MTTFALNARDLSIRMRTVCDTHGVSKETLEKMLCDILANYTQRQNKEGKYICELEDQTFVVYRVWTLIENDGEMTDVHAQWRVLDAEDEGFDDAVAGDEVRVQEPAPELTRNFWNWFLQAFKREMSRHRQSRHA